MKYPDLTKVLANLVTIGLGAVILCFIAIYNTFPLTFNSDTAMYMEAAFNGKVLPHRPILYGLFMSFFSFEKTLWIVVISQAIIVSIVIFYNFKYFLFKVTGASLVWRVWFLSFICLITFCMGASFETSWLMVDIFTPVCILCIILILMVNDLSRFDLFCICMIMIVSLCMHNTNALTGVTLIIILLLAFVFKRTAYFLHRAGISLKRTALVLSMVISSFVLSSLINYTYGGGFRPTKGGTIFLFGNIVEMGIADNYLAEACSTKKYAICAFRDSIPNNYLWVRRSPLYKTGGWAANEKEYSMILSDVLTTPKYLKTFIFNSVTLTLKQFFKFDSGEASRPSPRVKVAIRDYYFKDHNGFIGSKQYLGRLNFDVLNFLQRVIVGGTILLYIFYFFSPAVPPRVKAFLFIALLVAIINAWICGTFSGVYPRYQSRLVWVLPLPLFLFLPRNVHINILSISNYLNLTKLKYGNHDPNALPK